jgi:hypothetical protein
VFTVMLPLPPNGVALAVGAAGSLVRTTQLGPLRLEMSGVPVDVRPKTKPAQAMAAPMMLTMNAGVFMVAPMFCLPPDVARDTDSTIRAGRYRLVPPRRFGHALVYPRTVWYKRCV